jgi:hypothetical protein
MAAFLSDGLGSFSEIVKGAFVSSPLDPRLANATGETPVVRGTNDALASN